MNKLDLKIDEKSCKKVDWNKDFSVLLEHLVVEQKVQLRL